MNDQSGFTLIEVVIGAAIFVIGILAVGAMQLGAIRTNATAGMVTDAYTIAGERIETFMTLNTTVPIELPTETENSRYTVAQDVAWNSTSVLRIDVTVTWQQRGNNREIIIRHLKHPTLM